MPNTFLKAAAGLLLVATAAGADLAARAEAAGPSGMVDTVAAGALRDAWWRGYLAAPRVALPDGRRLTLFCQGKGTPVVMLDIGLGGGAWGWSTVQGEMAKRTRVCSYDRAGYSNSDPAKAPRTFDALEADLAALLTAAKLPGPYVMVGQSLGGPIVGLFAHRHPQQVAGLVLVDPSTGNQTARLTAVAPDGDQTVARIAAATKCARAADAGTLLPGSELEKACVAPDRPGFEPPAFVAETYRKWQRGSILRAKLAETAGVDFSTLQWPSGLPTRAPVIVLTSSDWLDGSPQDRALFAVWNTMHDEIAASSPDGVNCVVPRSTHSMMSSRPDVVVAAVSAMVDAVRAGRAIGSAQG